MFRRIQQCAIIERKLFQHFINGCISVNEFSSSPSRRIWRNSMHRYRHFIAMCQHATHVFCKDNSIFSIYPFKHNFTRFYIHTGSRILSAFSHFKLGSKYFHLSVFSGGNKRRQRISSDTKINFSRHVDFPVSFSILISVIFQSRPFGKYSQRTVWQKISCHHCICRN